ncbi:hypothetical protein Bca52824_003223 [Brassica carinata]|uniref:Uncharacterized protein n=1 Tax=Brassica carinata TaxID=52824 RepID=A0A8X7WJF6_BRACI|nr:hypothetical protein Bca52824_003223 [Brassica carinata]
MESSNLQFKGRVDDVPCKLEGGNDSLRSNCPGTSAHTNVVDINKEYLGAKISVEELTLVNNSSNVDSSRLASLSISIILLEDLLCVHPKTSFICSSFSQVILKRAMKEKGVVGKTQETPPEFVSEQDFKVKKKSWIIAKRFLDQLMVNEKKRHGVSLFRQLVELVDSAHSRGLFLLDLRLSFFALVPSKKLRYTGTFGKNNLEEDLNRKRSGTQESSIMGRDQKKRKIDLLLQLGDLSKKKKKNHVIDLNEVDAFNPDSCELQQQNYRKRLGQWYTCPEEINGENIGEKSNIYALGVLLFESSEMHAVIMANLRHQILPPTFLSKYPKEAGFCLWLLHPKPSSRPTAWYLALEILKSELITKDDSAISTAADDEISELLLHFFLSSVEKQKRKNASKLLSHGDNEGVQSSPLDERCTTTSGASFVPTANTDRLIHQLEVFFEGLCKFARYSKLETCGTIRSGDLSNSTASEHVAAAGISKKIKIFFYFNAFMNESVGVQYPLLEMVNKSKLSCVCWNNYIKNYLASTDYDGVVQIWDARTGQGFSHYTEHQKRAWSVDFSPSDPTKFSMQKRSLGTIWSPANVGCVQFSAHSNHLLAFGSADYKIYCYDFRYVRTPWCTLSGHEKKPYLNKTGLSPGAFPLTYKGYKNLKNFVGLSVLGGYVACGSETNEIFFHNNKNCYKSLPMPMTSHKFGSVDPISGNECLDDNEQFVSSVCWRKKSNMLVAANSTGNMKLLKLV